jgi:hypothetical protein
MGNPGNRTTVIFNIPPKSGIVILGVFMEIKDFTDEVISCKNKTITDEVFLLIQNNKDFMQKYLQLVREQGLDVVNRYIGQAVWRKYGLTPDDGRNMEPRSTLILSHQEFE